MKCFQTESKYLYSVAVHKSSVRKYIYDHIEYNKNAPLISLLSFILSSSIFISLCIAILNYVDSYQAFTKYIYGLVNINQLNLRKGLTWPWYSIFLSIFNETMQHYAVIMCNLSELEVFIVHGLSQNLMLIYLCYLFQHCLL